MTFWLWEKVRLRGALGRCPLLQKAQRMGHPASPVKYPLVGAPDHIFPLSRRLPFCSVMDEIAAKTEQSFDPRTEVSADAKYLVKQLVLWFLVFPPVLVVLIWVLYYAATRN